MFHYISLNMARLISALFLVWAMSFCGVASAEGVVAVVNDDIISDYDIYNRSKLVILTSKLSDDEETMASLRPQVLDALINDRIKMQVAKDNNISVSDGEINSVIKEIERRGGMGEGLFHTFLTMNHVEPTTIDVHVRADLMWQKLVAKRFKAEAKISSAELDDEIEKVKHSFNVDRVWLSGIFMAVKKSSDDKAVHDKAIKVYRELKDGADFGVLADNFSDSIIAGKGGDLGWINRGVLENDLDKAVFAMDVDAISEPLRGKDGYYIFKINDKRKAFDGVKNLYSVSRVIYGMADEDEVLSKIKSLSKESCDAFNEYAYSLKDESGEMVVSEIDDFPDEFVTKLNNMKQFDISSPFEFEDKMNIIMLCNIEKKYPLPDKEKILMRMAGMRLERIASRYLSELRRNAVIKFNPPK